MKNAIVKGDKISEKKTTSRDWRGVIFLRVGGTDNLWKATGRTVCLEVKKRTEETILFPQKCRLSKNVDKGGLGEGLL